MIPTIKTAGLIAAMGLAACSPSWQVLPTSVASTIEVPDKYETMDCQQLKTTEKGLAAEEIKLRDLIGKAQQDTGGTIAITTVYWPKLATVRADRRFVRESAGRINCALDAPPALPAPPAPTAR